MKQYNILPHADIDTIEESCGIAIVVLDEDGFVEYFSGKKSSRDQLYFYKTHGEWYLVRNLHALCKFK